MALFYGWKGIFFLLLAVSVFSSMALGISYVSDRMNYPPGASRVHVQFIKNVTGSVVVTIPSGFSLSNASLGGAVTAANVTWSNLDDASLNFTLSSPSNCTENDFASSTVYVNGSSYGTFPFICTADNKIVDFKVEYGHGNANYFGIGDELFISNRSATIFNLARVFNLGYLLTPNELPQNASLFCEYELLPVRTYGPGEVRRSASAINMSYLWQEIRSGTWFRIGVVSQDFTARPPGTSYNVSCKNLTYQFAHTVVQAPFTNYSLMVRSEEAINFTRFNDTEDITKRLFLVKNVEKYTIYDVKIIFRQANSTSNFEYPFLGPNQSLIYRLDYSVGNNVSAFYVPSWFRHSTDPQILASHFWFNGTPNTNPWIRHPGNLTALTNSTFFYRMNATDRENQSMQWSDNASLFNITKAGVISFRPKPADRGNHTVGVIVVDENNLRNSTQFVIEVRDPIIPSTGGLAGNGFDPAFSVNWSNVTDWGNVSGVQLVNSRGGISWLAGVSLDRADTAVFPMVTVANDFVAISTSQMDSTYNNSALLEFYNSSCPENQKPVVSFQEGLASLAEVQATGIDCVSANACENVTCSVGSDGLGNVSFYVRHFTGFAAFGNANLTINNSGTAVVGATINFSAFYINRTSGAHVAGAMCNISVSDNPGRLDNMTDTGASYFFGRAISALGVHTVNVTCGAAGFTAIQALDNITIGLGGGGGSNTSTTTIVSAGGTGGSGGPSAVPGCAEDWECAAWTPCISSNQYRFCFDKNACGTNRLQPPLVQQCAGSVPVYNVTFAPTCADGIQNQGEAGVDCAGPCPRACPPGAYSQDPQLVLLREERPAVPSKGSCGDGICAVDESCSCGADCGAPPISCPRISRTIFLGIVVLGLMWVVLKVYAPRPKRRQEF